MASAWGQSWANAWGNSWGSVQQETVIIIGGDDAPGHKRRKRKERHELYREIDETIHGLLNPAVGVDTGTVEGADAASSDVAGRTGPTVDELLVLAQGEHDKLQRVSVLRAELRAIEAAKQRAIAAQLQQDDDEMMMLS